MLVNNTGIFGQENNNSKSLRFLVIINKIEIMLVIIKSKQQIINKII